MINDLIFDCGMNDGTDTEHYLSKGFRVVAIEANPQLVQVVSERLQPAIADGRSRVIHAAIGPEDGTCEFWVNEADTGQSSLFEQAAAAGNRANCRRVSVPSIRFGTLLAEYGVPHYMKIDLEDADNFCLKDLSPDDLPQYISVEAHSLESLSMLSALGYRHFKCIDQTQHGYKHRVFHNELPHHRVLRSCVRTVQRGGRFLRRRLNRADSRPFPFHRSSGPFGEETVGNWQSLEEVAYNWLHRKMGYADRGTLSGPNVSWHDFHAKLG